MIVMGIIAVLLMVAVPSYQESMKKSRRADGMRDLMELVSREERFYAQYSRYTDDIASPGGLNFPGAKISERCTFTPKPGTVISAECHYELSVVECATKDEDDFSSCYIIRAAPIATGLQKDDKCGTLSVDSTSRRTAGGAVPAGYSCW